MEGRRDQRGQSWETNRCAPVWCSSVLVADSPSMGEAQVQPLTVPSLHLLYAVWVWISLNRSGSWPVCARIYWYQYVYVCGHGQTWCHCKYFSNNVPNLHLQNPSVRSGLVHIIFFASVVDRSNYWSYFMLLLGIVPLQILFYVRAGDRSCCRSYCSAWA